jgi:hypothetical protein
MEAEIEDIETCNWCNDEVPCGCALSMVRDLNERMSFLELQFKAKEFKADMDKADRWMECLAGIEDKLSERIDDLEQMYREDAEADQALICEVADVHLSILKWEAKINELERRGGYNRDYGLDLHKAHIDLMEKHKALQDHHNLLSQAVALLQGHKKPYVCPACEGKCTRKLEPGESINPWQIPVCKACSASGIVWG